MSDTDSQPNLDFSGEDTSYLTHGIHSFPARFPPQIVNWALDEFLQDKPATVLDPMCGSGTTLVECMLSGHNSKGIDKDPLARLMTRVKTRPADTEKVEDKANLLKKMVISDINNYRDGHGELPKYESKIFKDGYTIQDNSNIDELNRPQWWNINHWFFDQVIDELTILNDCIQSIDDRNSRELFEIAFSSTIITKGKTSVVNAHDIAHSRAHQVEPDATPDTLQRFLEELDDKISRVREFSTEIEQRHGHNPDIHADVLGSEARDIPLDDNSVDLIITSPPYINALNYVRATKFSLYWLRWPDKSQKDITPEYIGTDRGSNEEFKSRLERDTSSDTANNQIRKIANNNERMAGVVHKFVEDMHVVLGEMERVLKPQCECIVVIGNSDIRDVHVETHQILNELAEEIGFEVEREIPRNLDNKKRSLPTNRGDMKDGMSDEFVLQWESIR